MDGATLLLVSSIALPVIGLLAAVVARTITRWAGARVQLSWAASTLCGIIGAAAGGGIAALLSGRSALEAPVLVLMGGVVGTVIVLLVAEAVARRRRPKPPAAAELIHAGESVHVEFKSAARYNSHTKERDPRIELVIASTVAGFLNARGGTLLIGVTDDGTVVGLDNDFQFMKQRNRDHYELWLRDLLTVTLGAPAAASVTVDFETIDEMDVCLVRVPPGDRPVFVRAPKQRATVFPVRIGNSTRDLATHEVIEYAVGRWRRRALAGRAGR